MTTAPKNYMKKHIPEKNITLECSTVHYAQVPSAIGAFCCENDIGENDFHTFDLIKGDYKYHNILCSH